MGKQSCAAGSFLTDLMETLKTYIGTKTYYKRVFVIMLPILLQNVITNFVNLLDNSAAQQGHVFIFIQRELARQRHG